MFINITVFTQLLQGQKMEYRYKSLDIISKQDKRESTTTLLCAITLNSMLTRQLDAHF